MIIPQVMLAQAGIRDEAEMVVEKAAIVLRKPKSVRPGWAEASKRIAASSEAGLAWPAFGNAGDAELEWS